MIVDQKKIITDSTSSVETSSPVADVGYRAVCKSAVMALVFGIFSLSVWLSPAFLLFPLIGLFFGLFAAVSIRRYPTELVGKPMMRIGTGLSAVMLVGGLGWHVYCYNTEVPPDYERISFRVLRPESNSRIPYGPATEALDGKKVFIKGYVRPSEKKTNLKNFILVGDFGQCCFGGTPKLTDVIAITLEGDLRVDYGWGLRHIGGVFRLNRSPKRTADKEVPQVVYTIEADYLK